ncbi:Zinc-binding alcohol dehydrogenase domain-containing protein cipb [Mycena sanguinolenta]|uniref:Zinc-binding alcohol dehydrogenase domain-containing protein cipb n=1 Tax=Mycena sanguinolenta TaxID=230812 RepID=A0A8H6YGY9_9AGAR|nr:Zinc-binding alcohol dehydrogenase domain-containing protein cipb [Mycena sanguinolenta]
MSTDTASSNKAAWLPAAKANIEVGPAPVPTPTGTEVVIQVHSAALNPADAAGIVHAVGPNNTRFKPGDRVIALCRAFARKNPAYSGFQLYSIVDEPMLAKIPDHMSFNEACVFGLGLATAAYSLFNKDALALDLPVPGGNAPNGKLLLIWGGASSVGGLWHSGRQGSRVHDCGDGEREELRPAARDGDSVVDDIVTALKGKGEMAGVFCAIIAPAVLAQCAAIIGRLEGRKHVATVRPPGFPALEDWPEGIETSVNASTTIAETEVGRGVFGVWLEAALADGSIKGRPQYDVVGRGLEGVQGALDMMFEGVSAKKLVVEIA